MFKPRERPKTLKTLYVYLNLNNKSAEYLGLLHPLNKLHETRL